MALYRKVVAPEEADIVRRIYQWNADVHSPKSIASRLNEQGIPSSRGGMWTRSAIYGDQLTGVGILSNPLYMGIQIWNRSKWITHPNAKSRKSVERDPSEWVTTGHPELRIIDEDIYTWVAARLQSSRTRGNAV